MPKKRTISKIEHQVQNAKPISATWGIYSCHQTTPSVSVRQVVPSLPSVSNYGTAKGAPYTALFVAEAPPLGYNTYHVRDAPAPPKHSLMTPLGARGPQEDIVMANEYLRVRFCGSSGLLCEVTELGTGLTVRVEQNYFWYAASNGTKVCVACRMRVRTRPVWCARVPVCALCARATAGGALCAGGAPRALCGVCRKAPKVRPGATDVRFATRVASRHTTTDECRQCIPQMLFCVGGGGGVQFVRKFSIGTSARNEFLCNISVLFEGFCAICARARCGTESRI